ncbi:MAG: DUF4340 domain-containing protein [Chloroflexi bacterium]|nr:DUF4340 domain-containing protein [Chloroflexota bacterium]
MNFRITVILLVALILVGGYVYFYELRRPTQIVQPPLWFYNLDQDRISGIDVTYNGKKESFVRDAQEKSWRFNDAAKTPVNLERWGGITLLLSGPQSKRLLCEEPGKPGAKPPCDKSDIYGSYGLKNPSLVVDVTLEDKDDQTGKLLHNTFTLFIGDKTPDGSNHYVQMKGFPQIFLVDGSWGEVLSRLVTEPPSPKPTPTQVPS